MKADDPSVTDQREATFLISSLRAVLADRERELLELKGPCSNRSCVLHYAHSGPCNDTPRSVTNVTVNISPAPGADRQAVASEVRRVLQTAQRRA